jgi:hypothetical protein
LPAGWNTRLQRIQNVRTNGRVGYCLDVLDLFMAKAVADREKDRIFNMALLQHGFVTSAKAIAMVSQMPIDEAAKGRLRTRIQRWTRALKEQGHLITDE